MFGRPEPQSQIYFAIDIESWIDPEHPLRGVKRRVDEILKSLRPKFRKAYSLIGRPSVPPEMLLKALLLQSLYSIRSERQLVADIRVNLLYRWFLDLPLDAPVWDATTFTKNRERFQKHGLLRSFFDRVVEGAYVEQLMSEEHFAVDGTLIQSYASMKSVRRMDSKDRTVSDGAEDDDPGNPTVNFRGEKRSNRTHRSLTDPEARLARKAKGQPSVLAHALHVLTENRHGLIVDLEVTEANGRAEREAAVAMVRRTKQRRTRMKTLAGDRGYDAGAFLLDVEEEGVTPMVAIRKGEIRSKTRAAAAQASATQADDWGLRGLAAKAQVDGGNLWLVEDHRWPETKPSRGALEAPTAVAHHGRSVQPPSDRATSFEGAVSLSGPRKATKRLSRPEIEA
ncbi:MAG: IS5 family transposase [Gemmatimonadetes bacterium]|nr:IS5 family transposase [Gemmatimonadota bacterium]